jgi:ABC-type nitrate/sulfonate/bicarbonate transport system substrate-binding protein
MDGVLGTLRRRRREGGMHAALALLLALACTAPAPAPPASGPTPGPAATLSAGAGSSLAPAGTNTSTPAAFPRPEKEALEIAVAGTSSTGLPLYVAIEAGLLQRHGLSVNVSVVAANVAVQGLISNTIDIYQGGTATIAGRLGGADILYVSSLVDRSSLTLFGERGITAFTDFRGKGIATTTVGAFGEIALLHSAREYGMVAGQDFEIRYHPGSAPATTTFRAGNAQGIVITPPSSTELARDGYPTIIDYYRQGLKIIGPALAVKREFARDHPNTIRAYMRALLDGMRRAIDDRDFAMAVHAKYAQVDDPRVLAEDYEIGFQLWNRDMTVDPASIAIVLETSPLPNARAASPQEFYDNSIIAEVNTTYGAAVFPEVFRAAR